jgi:hypothetical protein
MQPRDKPEFARILLGLSTVKPSAQKLTAEGLEMFWLAMQDWDLLEFKAAASHLVRSCEFMPNPYHFEKLRSAASARNADAAFEEILARHGECDDPAGARALRSLGGWRVVGFSDQDRLPWLKERFRDAYENFAFSQHAGEALPLLAPASRGTKPVSNLLDRTTETTHSGTSLIPDICINHPGDLYQPSAPSVSNDRANCVTQGDTEGYEGLRVEGSKGQGAQCAAPAGERGRGEAEQRIVDAMIRDLIGMGYAPSLIVEFENLRKFQVTLDEVLAYV